MVRLEFELNAPAGAVQGVKEHLAMYLERFGDLRLVAVKEVVPQQMKIAEQPNK